MNQRFIAIVILNKIYVPSTPENPKGNNIWVNLTIKITKLLLKGSPN
jgi:hypothetical protein